MRVLAVDPGPHTGLALYDSEPPPCERCGKGAPCVYGTGKGAQVCAPERFISWENQPYPALEECRLLIIEGVDAVVCEGFQIGGQRGKASNVTIEMIGVLRWVCHNRSTLFVEQPPGLGKKFAGARWEKLRRLEWYRPGPDHANSAAGHLIHYLAKEAPNFASRLVP